MRCVTVGLLWHSLESANLGVGALTYAQMHLVTEAAERAGVGVRFVLVGWVAPGEAADDARVHATCQVNGRRLLGIDRALFGALAQCDLVLDIGEGDSFSDIYGWKRLVYLVATKLVAARNGRALVLSPQTIGPFKNPIAARLADMAMSRAQVVCPRDRRSTAYLSGRALACKVHEAIDVAFALPFERRRREGDRIQVGINVSGLLWAGGYTGKNQFGLKLDYPSVMLEIVDRFLAIEGVEVVLVPHVVAQGFQEEDDLYASRALQALRPGVSIAGPFKTAMDAKGFISGLDFFTGARMHACIGAFSAGVPCVPMAYSRKFTGLFDTLDYPHVADCTSDDAATVVSRIMDGFEGRAELAGRVARGNDIAQARLAGYRDVLVELLGRFADV